jgi:transposase InsO family protein
MTFGILYCFFVIAHDRRRILHFHVTRDPESLWIAQQLREAFPYEHRFKYLIFDRDAKFGKEVLSAVESIELASVRTSFKSPWQNGTAERWVGSCRRDLLDHVIVLNERHLRRLLFEYVRFYHEDRTHLGLNKETPGNRPTAIRTEDCRVISKPRLGGLHHRYDLVA